MQILLAGTPSTTVAVARTLVSANHTIIGVLCPFPKPIGRKQIVTPCALEMWARNFSVPIFHVDSSVLADHKNLAEVPKADVFIVADFGFLIPPWLLSYCQHGALNLHPSLLPRWRGATPVPFTLLFGDRETGISIIQMNEKFDMGAVVAQRKVEILEDDTTPTLLDRCFSVGAQLLLEVLLEYVGGALKPIPQPISSPTPMTRKFTKEDGCVPYEALVAARQGLSFDSSPIKILAEYGLPQIPVGIYQMCRGLAPWPGVWATLPNGKRLKVLSSTFDGKRCTPNLVQLEGKTAEKYMGFDRL
ncbi:MAG: methionyl-tRNA formyltransferase [Candidatus Pacebacteria bacterium]|nr:methionyl-tRNA formyltransferase [Candidatus Paceibacterota bacterium]